MKTTSNKTEKGSIWASFKTAFYAFQVIVIAIAIPALSYLEMSYDTKPAQEQTRQCDQRKFHFRNFAKIRSGP